MVARPRGRGWWMEVVVVRPRGRGGVVDGGSGGKAQR